MRFSLVLATVGRTEELDRFLASLRAQGYQDFELIVVDQNQDDRLLPILEPCRTEMRIHHLRLGSRGASRARNAGLACVSGDIVAFPDDDCQYPPDLLLRVVEVLRAHPELAGVTGRSADSFGRNSNGRFDRPAGLLDRLNVWTRAIEYTVFLRREFVSGLWFDEDLGVGAGTRWGAGEMTDYMLHLLGREAPVYYCPELAIVHPSPVPPYDEKALRRAFSYGSGMGRVLTLHDMPLWFKAKWLVRPLGGTMLSLANLKTPRARYHWNTFRGRAKGLAS